MRSIRNKSALKPRATTAGGGSSGGGGSGGGGSGGGGVRSSSMNTSSGGGGGGGGLKKITIKPFAEPPVLPPNFYEVTSKKLLEETLAEVLDPSKNRSNNDRDHHGHGMVGGGGGKISLQKLYTSVINLVSHQYGPRLYKDLRQTMQQAAMQVLPDDAVAAIMEIEKAHKGSSSSSSNSSSSAGIGIVIGGVGGLGHMTDAFPSSSDAGTEMLALLQKQYMNYVNYVLLCKHTFLPLDRTHLWQEDSQTVIKHTNNATNYTSCNNQSLWEVGLSQFRNRLIYLKLDVIVYQHWFRMLINDWMNCQNKHTSPVDDQRKQLLQQTYYMWSDLHMLPKLLNQLQSDLQSFLNRTSITYKTKLPYQASFFISFVYEKWIHMSSQWTFLPKSWLCTLLEVHLLKPHLSKDWLLLPKHFNAILEQEVANISTSSSSSPPSATTSNNPQSPVDAAAQHTLSADALQQSQEQTSVIVKLWMLAGRLPNGYQQVADCIASYAKTKGLAIINHTNHLPPTGSKGSANSGSSTNMIADLLDLQQQLHQIVNHILPKGADHVKLKSVWEHVLNSTPPPSSSPNNSNNVPQISVAEALAKFVDQILKSAKKMDQYSIQTSIQTAISKKPDPSLQPQKDDSASKYPASSTPEKRDNMNTNNDFAMPNSAEKAVTETKAATAAAVPSTPTGALTTTQAQNNDLLSRIIRGVFVHLQAKDIFEAFYKRDLAKRLLWNRVVSMDVETHFCSLIKAECGAAYTSKMEGMFQDIHWSREAMSRYKQTNNFGVAPSSPAAAGKTPTAQEHIIEMEAQVLTTGYWPVYPQYAKLILPPSLKLPQERFTTYYKTKYQGRRMTWQYALGHCIVRANGFFSSTTGKKGNRGKIKVKPGATKIKKVYELVVSLCQALVLIQFSNDDSKYTLPQLMATIGLEDRDEMERILQSLSLGKDGTRVLRKIDHDAIAAASNVPTSNDSSANKTTPTKKVRLNVHDLDSFIINANFDSHQRRIRVTNIMLKETKEERDKTVETVSRDRLYMIDASLVRTLKARKTITHQELIPQVLEQVKVPVQSADIKKRIESLIEREYMERDQKDRQRYNYLA